MRSRAARTRTSEIFLPHVRSHAYERSITPSNFARTRTSTIRSQALCARTRTSEIFFPLLPLALARVRAMDYPPRTSASAVRVLTFAHARVRAQCSCQCIMHARTHASAVQMLTVLHARVRAICSRGAKQLARVRAQFFRLKNAHARVRAR